MEGTALESTASSVLRICWIIQVVERLGKWQSISLQPGSVGTFRCDAQLEIAPPQLDPHPAVQPKQ